MKREKINSGILNVATAHPAQPTTEMAELPVGTRVRIHSLSERAELNSRFAVVSSLPAGGLVGVRVEGEPAPLALKPGNLETCSPPSLAELGYEYVRGPSADPDDWVLRQLGDPAQGFRWRDQKNYDAVGEEADRWIRAQLVEKLGLHPLACAGGATAYASPGLRESAAPLLLLVCGAVPGGYAGVWGRSLSAG